MAEESKEELGISQLADEYLKWAGNERKSGKEGQLLEYLGTNYDKPKALTIEAIIDGVKLGTKPNLATVSARLRKHLEFYFYYTAEGLKSEKKLRLSEAEPGKQDQGKALQYSVSVVEDDEKKFPITGPRAFWHPHLVSRNGKWAKNSIVFTEPLMFRHKAGRFFIRHLDISGPLDIETAHGNRSQSEARELASEISSDREKAQYIDRLVQYLNKLATPKPSKKSAPYFRPEDFVVSRGYVPGGEVLGKDALRRWLLNRADEISHHYDRPLTGEQRRTLVEEHVSRRIERENAPQVHGRHLILLGSLRTNSLIRTFQSRVDWLPLKITPHSIHINKRSKEELGRVKEGILKLEKNAPLKEMMRNEGEASVHLSEDWAQFSFALVTRTFGDEKGERVTVIAANQGRGIQAMCEDVLTNDGHYQNMMEKFEERGFKIEGRLPKAFQMLFAVRLIGEEAWWDRWEPLLYVPISKVPENAPPKVSQEKQTRPGGRGKKASAS